MTLTRQPQTDTSKAGWLALLASVLTVGLITYGAWVRASGSGLGCPDWPLCEGALVPNLDGATAIEFGHRVFAGATMLVVGASAWFAYRGRAVDKTLAWLLGASVATIIVQAILGGITVLTELHGNVRLAHLATAMLTLALVTAAAIRGLGVPGSVQPGFKIATGLMATAAFVVFVGGTIVGSNLSGACPGLPYCDDRSPLNAAWLHGIHRTVGVLLLIALIATAVWLHRHRGSRLAVSLNHAAILFVVLQITIGVLTIWQSLAMPLRILHLGMATMIWWTIVTQWLLALKGRSG